MLINCSLLLTKTTTLNKPARAKSTHYEQARSHFEIFFSLHPVSSKPTPVTSDLFVNRALHINLIRDIDILPKYPALLAGNIAD